MAVDDEYTKSLLHLDGADGSTTFTDESGKSWTVNGNAQIDTAVSKFGGACGLFDGNGDYISTPDHDDWCPETYDFTIDCWIRRNTTGRHVIFGQVNFTNFAGAALALEVQANHTLMGQIGHDGNYGGVVESTTTITNDGQFHHVAFIRYFNDAFVAVDGSIQGGLDVTDWNVNNVALAPSIGRPGTYNGFYWSGWIDEFRYSKGIARWTANFTPPTVAYLPGPPKVKTVNGVAAANIKTINGIAIANVKSVQGLT